MEWTAGSVMDEHSKLGNSMQYGLDCGLHSCVTPIFFALNEDINVFGTKSEDRKKAGIEMRRRMILSLCRNECMFKPALKN